MLLFISCDQQITQPEQEEKLLDIPDWGKSALPSAAADQDGEENNVAADMRTSSAKTILKEYAEKHPEAPYISIAGIWYPEKELYKYEIYPLDFKPEVIKQADGEKIGRAHV